MELVHADIFFFVTTIVVIIIGIGFLVALFFGAKILKDISIIVRNVKDESSRIAQDISLLRNTVREEGTKLKALTDVLGGLGSMLVSVLSKKRSSSKKKKRDPISE